MPEIPSSNTLWRRLTTFIKTQLNLKRKSKQDVQSQCDVINEKRAEMIDPTYNKKFFTEKKESFSSDSERRFQAVASEKKEFQHWQDSKSIPFFFQPTWFSMIHLRESMVIHAKNHQQKENCRSLPS